MKRIVCFHLLNDYSGSPKVLRMILEGMLKKGYRIDLVSSVGGALDGLESYDNFSKHSYHYRFSTHSLVTVLRYCLVQVYTFFLAFRWLFQKNVVFYINTLLPVGPALAGRLMGKRVIYHYHENASVKGAFYKTLAFCMQKLAHEIICVSAYQASFLKRKEDVCIIPNALTKQFVDRLKPESDLSFGKKRILMLGSLKLYKGPLEFIQLARMLPQFSFELVVNDTIENINHFIIEQKLSIAKNLVIHPRQNNVIPFYNRASIVLNLSNKKSFVETFGLTALEAMSAGLPVIVPTEGGIAEMVDNGVNGYKIDIQNLSKIADSINKILSDKKLYSRLSHNALVVSHRFDETSMINQIIPYLN